MVTQFVRGEFHSFQEPTIGAAFLTSTVVLAEDDVVKFEIWDTAGQERYKSLAPMYYRNSAASIVVFDVASAESFTGAKSWVKELQRRGDANVVIALAGNKIDVENRVVTKEEANQFAEENGIIYMETSAKTGFNVKELFLAIARRLPKTQPANLDSTSNSALPISANSNNLNQTPGCC